MALGWEWEWNNTTNKWERNRYDIPQRLARKNVPIIPNAHLRVRLVDANGRELEVTSATMHIDMRFDDPFSYYNYQDENPLYSNLVYFLMPSNLYSVTAFITVEIPGFGKSEPLVLTNEAYWNLFERAFEVGSDYLLEHTFIIGQGNAKPSFFVGATLEKGQSGKIDIPQGILQEIFAPGTCFEERPNMTSPSGLQSNSLVGIGLQMNPNTGTIVGTPSAVGTFLIWIEVLVPDSRSVADIWIVLSVRENSG